MITLRLLVLFAFTVFPTSSSRDSWGTPQESRSLKETLGVLRDAIDAYAADHGGQLPDGDVITQLTNWTDRHGDPGTAFQPQLPEGIPHNPINGKNTVTVLLASPSAPSDSAGWLYEFHTGTWWSDALGTGADGVPYFEY